MEQKLVKLGRAKKKLRYFQTEECTPCQVKLKDVFSLQDLDIIFDDMDSPEPDTPVFSPLAKTTALEENDAHPLGAEIEVQMEHLNDKGSPIVELAPIKTSSPIELLTGNVYTMDTEQPLTTSPLFIVDNMELVVGDMCKPVCDQKSESLREFLQGDSESLVSPPAQLVFPKPAIEDAVPGTSYMLPKPSKALVIDSSEAVENNLALAAEVPENSHKDKEPSLTQNNQTETTGEEQPNIQVPEVAVETEVCEMSFQQKLLYSLQLRIKRKQQSDTQAIASPPVPEDDFMILDDDAPFRFVIPKKTYPTQKDQNVREHRSAKSDLKENASHVGPASPQQTTKAQKGTEKPGAAKPNRKAKQGKSHEGSSSVDTAAAEESEPLKMAAREEREVCDQLFDLIETIPTACVPVTGRRKTIRKTKPDKHGSKQVEGVKLPAEKLASKIKSRITTVASSRQEKLASNVKKKASKAKSTKTSAHETESSIMADQKQSKNYVMVKNKNKQQPEKQQLVAGDRLDSYLEPTDPLEVQSSTANKSIERPKTKPPVSKKPVKVSTLGKTKDLPVPESRTSADVPAFSKRKRKPPGEWWLTQHDEHSMLEQRDEAQPSQELKPNKKTKKAAALIKSTKEQLAGPSQESLNKPIIPSSAPKRGKNLTQSQADGFKTYEPGNQKNVNKAGKRSIEHCEAPPHEMVDDDDDDATAAAGQLSPIAQSPPRWHNVTPGDKRVFSKTYTRDNVYGSVQKDSQLSLDKSESIQEKRLKRARKKRLEVSEPQEFIKSSQVPRDCSPLKSRSQKTPTHTAFKTRLQKTSGHALRKTQIDLINVPKSFKRSLATFNAIMASGRSNHSTVQGPEIKQKGRRNLMHSLEDQSEQSSENVQEEQRQESSHEVCMSGVTTESFAAKKANIRFSKGSTKSTDADFTLKSGPSSFNELEMFQERDCVDLSSKTIPQTHYAPRVLSDCDLCGPPLRPIVLEAEDWANLCTWFSLIWPTTAKNSQVISPDDFHWYCYAGRAMGHMVDLQTNIFSSGKVLLGSFMEKPMQVDLNAVTVFNVASSCVRVEIDGVQQVYNSGRTFMTPCGQPYRIHNMGREPAVLWYHRMLRTRTRN